MHGFQFVAIVFGDVKVCVFQPDMKVKHASLALLSQAELEELPQQWTVLGADEVPSVDDLVLSALAKSSLSQLSLQRCSGASNAGLSALIAACRRLNSLDLSMTPVADDTVAVIAQHAPDLRRLALRKCAKLKGEAALIAVAQNGTLTHLDVGLCRGVTGALLIELAACCTASLLELDISFCRSVQPAAFGHMLDACVGLRDARIYGCSQLTRGCVFGHCNAAVRVAGAPTFEADEAGAVLAQQGDELMAQAADMGVLEDTTRHNRSSVPAAAPETPDQPAVQQDARKGKGKGKGKSTGAAKSKAANAGRQRSRKAAACADVNGENDEHAQDSDAMEVI